MASLFALVRLRTLRRLLGGTMVGDKEMVGTRPLNYVSSNLLIYIAERGNARHQKDDVNGGEDVHGQVGTNDPGYARMVCCTLTTVRRQ